MKQAQDWVPRLETSHGRVLRWRIRISICCMYSMQAEVCGIKRDAWSKFQLEKMQRWEAEGYLRLHPWPGPTPGACEATLSDPVGARLCAHRWLGLSHHPTVGMVFLAASHSGPPPHHLKVHNGSSMTGAGLKRPVVNEQHQQKPLLVLHLPTF